MKKATYMETEQRILTRFSEIRNTVTFLEEAIEILDEEFDKVRYADEIIESIIANEE